MSAWSSQTRTGKLAAVPPTEETTTDLLAACSRSLGILCAEEVSPTSADLYHRLQRQSLADHFRLLSAQTSEHGIRWLIVTGTRPEQAMLVGWSEDSDPQWAASNEVTRDDLHQDIPSDVAGTLNALLLLLSAHDFRSMFSRVTLRDIVPAKLTSLGVARSALSWALDVGAAPGLAASLEAELFDGTLVPDLFAA